MPIDGAQIVKSYDALKTQRAQRDSVINVVAPYTDPSRGDTSGEPVEGQAWMTQVYDSEGLFAHDLSAHYIQGQSTNPGKKWFGLRDENEDIAEDDEVAEWCEESRDRMLHVIDKSNFYGSDFQVRKDWWGFGCGSGLAEERKFLQYKPMMGYRGVNVDFDMIGRFVAAWDSWGELHMHGVERMWSAEAAVERFGLENVSTKIKQAYTNGKVDEKFKFVHFISPRGGTEYGQTKKQQMPFKWCWVEYDSKQINQEGGYEKIPALVPRQNGLFGESYGRGRADIALNDLLTLSTGMRLSFEDWALKIRPITIVRQQTLFGQQNLVPGSMLQAAQSNMSRPLSDAFFKFDGGGSPEVSQFNVEQLKMAIKNSYMIQQLAQLLQLQGTHQQTAYERAQMERYVLRLIASVHTSYQHQFLQPFIDILFDQMFRAGEFSPPPDIMLNEGGKLAVVFDSPLATTQVIDEVQAMEEIEMKLLNHAKEYFAATQQISPALDLIDWEDWYRTLATKLKVPAKPVRSLQQVAVIQNSRAEAEQKQMVNQELAGGAEALGKVAPFLKAVTGDKKAA